MPRLGITAYDLLISCPGDTVKYYEIIKECIEGFNTAIGRINNSEIVGKHWSTDSYAQSGDKPQELLNKQFVRECDAAVAVFWTRFGTQTDKYGSGTEEEIEEMLSAGKQVFVYFIEESIDISNIDTEQLQKVREFKEKYKKRGLFFSAKNTDEFRRLFMNHLSMYFLPVIVGEKSFDVVSNIPKLCVRDYISCDEIKSKKTTFSDSEFIEKMEQNIIREIETLKLNYLEPRDNSNKKDDLSKNASQLPDLKESIQKIQLQISTISDADIPDEWKRSINGFAKRIGLNIPIEFWYVGNLKKSIMNFNSMFGGGVAFSGTEAEKGRYNSISTLYENVRKLNEYLNFFRKLDSFCLLRLVVANVGTSFDEDVDVKLIFEKGVYVKWRNLPIPGKEIIDEVLQMEFIDNSYKIKATDTVDSFSGYPVSMPVIDNSIFNPFSSRTSEEEYNDSKERYLDSIDEVFCYEYYEKPEVDVLTFHIDYLKHNTMMAFPSCLIFSRLPEKINYEICSKHIPDVIKGELDLTQKDILDGSK